MITFGCVNQQHLTKRQNGDQQRKRHGPLAANVDLSSLGEGLERALTEERAPSPTTPEPPSPIGSEETEEAGRTR